MVVLAPEFEFDGCPQFADFGSVGLVDVVEKGQGVLAVLLEVLEEVLALLDRLSVGLGHQMECLIELSLHLIASDLRIISPLLVRFGHFTRPILELHSGALAPGGEGYDWSTGIICRLFTQSSPESR